MKTDWYGRLLGRTPTDPHGGDICIHDGKLYTGVWLMPAKKGERACGAIYMYDAETLELLKAGRLSLMKAVGDMTNSNVILEFNMNHNRKNSQ